MKKALILIASALLGIYNSVSAEIIAPREAGTYPVEVTNIEIADEFLNLEPEKMDRYLIGAWDESEGGIFWDRILKHPEDAWVVDVKIPDDASLYETLAVV